MKTPGNPTTPKPLGNSGFNEFVILTKRKI
jgi:hypothetical protein